MNDRKTSSLGSNLQRATKLAMYATEFILRWWKMKLAHKNETKSNTQYMNAPMNDMLRSVLEISVKRRQESAGKDDTVRA
jgi:hypothetical protein